MNLLNETRSALRKHKKSFNDVRHIITDSGEIQLADFRRMAFEEYDEGYGNEEVEPSLKILGDDWWLERYSYDGSEWWEYKSLPTVPQGVATRIFTTEHWRNKKC